MALKNKIQLTTPFAVGEFTVTTLIVMRVIFAANQGVIIVFQQLTAAKDRVKPGRKKLTKPEAQDFASSFGMPKGCWEKATELLLLDYPGTIEEMG